MNEGLKYILNKQEIISTVSGQDLIDRPDDVRSDYQRHAYTHIPLGDTADIEKKMLSRVSSGKIALGAIVAPYGYGKTSTIVFIWHRAEEKDYVATPPFMMGSLLDVLDATYGWARFKLSQRAPDLADKLDLIYEGYTQSELEDRAKAYAKRYGTSLTAAKGILQDQCKSGELVLELTPAKLLKFIEETSELVTKAGYNGLILLPDEIQQYITKNRSHQGVIQNLREFVFGFRVKRGKMGLLLSMPIHTEAGIQEAGNDILDRLRDGNLYHNLADIYGLDFPAKLWERYVEELDIGEYSNRIFDDGSLEAIGQISSREDLGRGPRTVINLFKLAIAHFRDHDEAFTPELVIDAFLQGHVNFEDTESKVRIAVNEALSASVVNTEDKRRAIKLLAAFPNTGCPIKIQRRYKVEKIVEQLDKLHGVLISYQIDGYTLTRLLPSSDDGEGIIDKIIRRFWRTYNEDTFRAKSAQQAFINYIIPTKLFVAKRGALLTSWSEEEEIELDSTGCYSGIFNGTFSTKYPKRRLRVRIAIDEKRLPDPNGKADLTFDFLLNLDRELGDAGMIIEVSDNHLQFDFNILRRFDGNLPGDIKRLQEFVNPNRVTPLLMLSLIDFMNSQIEKEDVEINKTEEAQIEMFRNSLINHSIQQMLNRDLANTFELKSKLLRVGEHLVSQIFTQKCNELWPDYATFMVQSKYKGVIDDYVKALGTLSPRQRRSNELIEGTKKAIAVRFGYQSVATFQTKIESDFQHLVKSEEWKGRGDNSKAAIRVVLHPLEQVILKKLQSSQHTYEIEPGKDVAVLTHQDILGLGAPLGYRTEEIAFGLQLLVVRGYVRTIKDENLIALAFETRPKDEIIKEAKIFKQKVETLERLLKSSKKAKKLSDDLNKTLRMLNKSDLDDDTLSQIDYTCKQEYLKRLEELIQDYSSQSKTELADLNAEIRGMNSELFRVKFDEQIEGTLGFVMHLNELRSDLRSNLDKLNSGLETAESTYKQLNSNVDSLDLKSDLEQFADSLTKLSQSIDKFSARKDFILEKRDALEEWKSLNSRASTLFNNLSGGHELPDLVELRDKLTKELVPEIQEHLSLKKLDGLHDYEVFEKQLSTLESKYKEIVSKVQSDFGQLREKYEKLLQDSLGIKRSSLHANCNVSNIQESYKSLHKQVREKIESRASELTKRIHEIYADLLKVTNILEMPEEQLEKVDQVKEDYQSIKSLGDELFEILTLKVIGDTDEFQSRCDEFEVRIVKAGNLKEELEKLMRPQDVEVDEQELLTKINANRAVDLTEILVDVLENSPDTPTTEILEHLNSLYRKNRVKITISRIG